MTCQLPQCRSGSKAKTPWLVASELTGSPVAMHLSSQGPHLGCAQIREGPTLTATTTCQVPWFRAYFLNGDPLDCRQDPADGRVMHVERPTDGTGRHSRFTLGKDRGDQSGILRRDSLRAQAIPRSTSIVDRCTGSSRAEGSRCRRQTESDSVTSCALVCRHRVPADDRRRPSVLPGLGDRMSVDQLERSPATRTRRRVGSATADIGRLGDRHVDGTRPQPGDGVRQSECDGQRPQRVE